MALQSIMTGYSLTRQVFRMTVMMGTYPSGGNYEITASLAGSRLRSCRDGHVRRPCRMEAELEALIDMRPDDMLPLQTQVGMA